jgi:hypothetical protein
LQQQEEDMKDNTEGERINVKLQMKKKKHNLQYKEEDERQSYSKVS